MTTHETASSKRTLILSRATVQALDPVLRPTVAVSYQQLQGSVSWPWEQLGAFPGLTLARRA
jgi:hypothetical protein